MILRYFICVILLCISIGSSAQVRAKKVLNYQNHDDKAIHFGFCLGLNVRDFTITPSGEHYAQDSLLANVTSLSPGFHIQAVSNLRLGQHLDLRVLPGVSFGERKLMYYRNDVLYNDKQVLESSYIEIPILLKYKSKRINNYRGYIVGGVNPRFDLAKTYREDEGIYLDLKMNDICYELGAGFDFYLPYFKFSIELRGSWGMGDVLQRRSSTPHPEFQNAIEKLRSSVYMISFYFE